MKMSQYLFDASAIVNLVKRGATKILEKGKTLDLALYESLNAILKELTKLRRIDEKTASEYVELLSQIFKLLKVESIRSEEIKNVFNLALKEGLTIYDASYLHVAIRENLVLVTDDQELKNKASRHIKVLTTEELVETEGRSS